MSTESSISIQAKRRLNPFAQYLMVLAGVILAYSGYLQFVVPALEGPPSLIKKRIASISMDELPSPREQKLHLIPLLPADAWELDACKTLLIDAGTILYKKIEQQPDGTLEIVPFTLISGLENDSSAPASDAPAPTVLRCLDSAKLKLNKPFSSIFGGKAKVESARLNGRVDIYRPPSHPDQDDALHILTSNVQIDKHRIYTLEQVQFEFGPNHGSGRNMSIDLVHKTESSVLADFSSIDGVRRMELAFLDKLRVQSTEKPETNTAVDGSIAPNPTEPKSPNHLFSNNKSPLEITCQGPFVFDFRTNTASFKKQVVAQQIDAFNDNIQCDELVLEFQNKPKPAQPINLPLNPTAETEGSSDQKSDSDLELKRFIAKGSPAVVVSRSRSAKITGEYLSYNILTNQIDASCDSSNQQMVTIVSPGYQMVAKQLTYLITSDGSLGEIDVIGPGRLLRVGSAEKGDFYSSWRNSLTSRNVAGQSGLQRVVIDGSAEVRIEDGTSITAEKLDLLVWQLPKLVSDENNKVKRSWDYQPAKLTTTGNVTIASPKLDGQAEHLTATWPDPTGEALNTAARQDYRAGYRGTIQLQSTVATSHPQTNRTLARIPRSSRTFETQSGSTSSSGIDQLSNNTQSSGFVEQLEPETQSKFQDRNVKGVAFNQAVPQQPKKNKRKMKFKGRTVDIRLTGIGDQTEIQELTIVGDVSIVSLADKTQLPDPHTSKQQPLTITGHRLQLTPQFGESNYRTLISGKDGGFATVTSKDVELTGQNINLDQDANKVWIEGEGTLKLTTDLSSKPQQKELNGQLTNSIKSKIAPESLDVSWKGGMIFDGAKIYFERNVEMSSDQFSDEGIKSNIRSLSDGLSVELSKPVQFQNLQTDEKVSDAKIRELIFVDQLPDSKQRFKLANHSPEPNATAKRPVVIENRTFNAEDELSEQQRIVVPQAVVNMDSGAINSKGPGTISTHRKSKPSSDSTPDPFSRFAGKGGAQNKSGISFIQINFDGRMSADSNRHEMTLDRNIRTVYAPVQNWDESFDPDQVQKRAPGMVLLTCENMLLAQWEKRAKEGKTNELIATGNAHILSETFEVTADRVSYDQSTDLLTIVGTPRNDANLFFKQSPNDQNPTNLVANKITYRLEDQATGTFGVKTLNINRK